MANLELMVLLLCQCPLDKESTSSWLVLFLRRTCVSVMLSWISRSQSKKIKETYWLRIKAPQRHSTNIPVWLKPWVHSSFLLKVAYSSHQSASWCLVKTALVRLPLSRCSPVFWSQMMNRLRCQDLVSVTSHRPLPLSSKELFKSCFMLNWRISGTLLFSRLR